MYDRHLETFIQAADSGSFLKASEKLFISANAVTKQINLLENDLNLKLFQRSTQGLVLTEAGKLIYAEAKKMIRHSNSVLKKAHELESRQEYVVCVGVSLMNPASILLEQWHKASRIYPHLRLEIVPFEDTVPAFNEVLNRLGEDIDLISCPYETNYWGDRYNSFHLCDLPVRVACSKTHPLAGKEKLQVTDLYGETLIFGKRNTSANADQIRNFLEQNHPQIQIKEVESFDLPLFNQVVSSSDLIMSADCWKDVHPLLATLPVDWDFTLPYGLIYAKNPPREMLQFIMAIGNVL
ncbi:MAG TPA: LysR family transcriptional regulator [Firmicutes bacterium]|nr:LysR family transcriptional regulator [Bacillota bacterium]